MPENDKVRKLVMQVSDEPAIKTLKDQLTAANQTFEEHIHNLGDQLNTSRSSQEQKAYEAVAAPIRRQMAAAIYQQDNTAGEMGVRQAVVAIETEVEEKRREDKGPVQTFNDVEARLVLTQHIQEHVYDFPVLPLTVAKSGMPVHPRTAKSR